MRTSAGQHITAPQPYCPELCRYAQQFPVGVSPGNCRIRAYSYISLALARASSRVPHPDETGTAKAPRDAKNARDERDAVDAVPTLYRAWRPMAVLAPWR